MKQVIDNFSTGSAAYATYRPGSPKEIFHFLYSKVNNFKTAWDCGTGNGQVATVLAARFGKVYATDISSEQLALATKKDNIIFLEERAEQTSIPDSSIDLITVAQAIHWFDFDKFYTEVRRVSVPGAVIAAWTYSVLECTPAVDAVIGTLYSGITRAYWNKERDYVDAAYRTIPFPFREIEVPPFSIILYWSLEQLLGYLRTWSGVKHYIAKENRDPVLLVEEDLRKAWGSEDRRRIQWPVHMRAGLVR